MLPAVFKRAMLALLERVAADPLLQWRWPPLRQGIGRRWSLKVSKRILAHWHWLPMAHFEAAAGQPWQQGFIRADEVPPAHHCDREHGSEPAEARSCSSVSLPAATVACAGGPTGRLKSYLRFQKGYLRFRIIFVFYISRISSAVRISGGLREVWE